MIRKLVFLLWYFRKPPWDTNQTPPELVDFIKANPPGRALDLGCGTGTNVISLAENGWEATGIDFISRAIRTARRKAAKSGIKADYQVGDVSRLEGIQGPFDLILDIGCFHGLDPKRKYFYQENIRRLLKPGGTFLIYLFFQTGEHTRSVGVTESELEPFQSFLELVKRQDGTDHRSRRSAWITYRKPSDNKA